VPNQIALNQTMWNQIKACTDRSSGEICAPQRHYAEYSGNCLLMFRDVSVPSTRVKQSKRENTARLILLTQSYLLGLSPASNSLKMNDISEASSISVSRQST